MRIGLFTFSSAEDSVWRAIRAEARGFDSVWFPEFVTRRPDGREHGSPISTMSYVAALTRRISLGTAVIGMLKHDPAVLSQEIATLDRLSGGRVVLGLGPGARRQSVALGLDRRWDADFLVEYMEVMRAMWRWDPVEYRGRYFKVEGAPASRPYGTAVPIYVGTASEEGIRAAGRAADGWMANWIFSPAAFSELMSRVRDEARRAGRDPSALKGVYLTGVAMGGDREESVKFARELAYGVMPRVQMQDYGARLLEAELRRDADVGSPEDLPEEFVERTFLLGDQDSVVRRVEEYRKAGVDELILHFADEGSEELFLRHVALHIPR